MALFRHSNVLLSDAVFAIDFLGGQRGIDAIRSEHSDNISAPDYAYGGETLGRIEAFLNACGGQEVLESILHGEKELVVRELVRLCFNRHGRYIAPRDIKTKVCDPNRNFYLTQSRTTCAEELELYGRVFGSEFKLPPLTEYKDKTSALVERIKGSKDNPSPIANALKGVHLRWFLPQMDIADHGVFVQMLVNAAKRLYEAYDFGGNYPHRKFIDRRQDNLAGLVSIVPESRLDLLVERLKAGPVFGIQFPNCLQGYSALAQREIMATAPDGLILSGPETLVNFAVHSRTLGRDFKAPGLDLSAYQWKSLEYSFSLTAHDDHCGFYRRASLGSRRGNYSGGLSFIG